MRRYLFLILLGFLFISASFYLINKSKREEKREFYSMSQFGELKKEFDELLAEKGLASAVGLVKEKYSVGGSSINHAIQHYLGEIIYEKEGISGITICSDGRLGGCYHGLISKAYYEEGYEKTIGKITEICKNEMDRSVCLHALGHILLSDFGENNLQKALQICAGLKLGTNHVPCMSGVFMQYYFPSAFRFTFKEVNQDWVLGFNEARPYGECLEFKDKEFREACLLYTVEWWHFALKGDYSRIANLCGGLENKEDRENCFRDIGAIYADNGSREIRDIKKICAISASERDRLLCVSGSLRFLSDNFGAEINQTASEFCGEEADFCVVSARSMWY